MKFDVDYDKTFENEILLKAKKIGGGGTFKNDFFFANSDRKIFFIKTLYLVPISTPISFIWVPCSIAEISYSQKS